MTPILSAGTCGRRPSLCRESVPLRRQGWLWHKCSVAASPGCPGACQWRCGGGGLLQSPAEGRLCSLKMTLSVLPFASCILHTGRSKITLAHGCRIPCLWLSRRYCTGQGMFMTQDCREQGAAETLQPDWYGVPSNRYWMRGVTQSGPWQAAGRQGWQMVWAQLHSCRSQEASAWAPTGLCWLLTPTTASSGA